VIVPLKEIPAVGVALKLREEQSSPVMTGPVAAGVDFSQEKNKKRLTIAGR